MGIKRNKKSNIAQYLRQQMPSGEEWLETFYTYPRQTQEEADLRKAGNGWI